MSLTIQQIILDAKRLASRLKEHDSAADALLSQTQSVYKQIDAMKQVGIITDLMYISLHVILKCLAQYLNLAALPIFGDYGKQTTMGTEYVGSFVVKFGSALSLCWSKPLHLYCIMAFYSENVQNKVRTFAN